MSPITQGLIIAGIGMGLVFVAILALWGIMTLLVKVTADRPKAVVPQDKIEEVAVTIETATPDATSDKQHLHLAAAAAVAIALQMNQRSGQDRPQESGNLSPWQANRRAAFLSRPTNLVKRN